MESQSPQASLPIEPGPNLRADLAGISVEHGDRSARIVIDDIGGRFARIPNHLWLLLSAGKADARGWAQATAAGWTRSRTRRPRSTLSPLAIRVPLFNVDTVARHLSGVCDWIFAPVAVKFWVAMMVAATLLAMSQYRELLTTIGQLPSFFTSTSAWLLGSVFIGTKLLHELGHAVACRRAGVRCGSIGVIFFCGVPCPFCDVTQVWRNPNAATRAGVMLAGMYVEGILATMATMVWALADDGPARLHAMNVMIVCSISTLVFNANPLMRYDGYYVLSDWLGSVNLRSEARSVFRTVVQRVGRRSRGAVASVLNQRSVGLVIYYLASTAYRYLVLTSIVAAIYVFADSVGLKLLAMVGLLILFAMMAGKAVGRAVGTDRRSISRKLVVASLSAFVIGAIFLTPLPRRITVLGLVDAADAAEVFLSADGIIDSVSSEIGQRVEAGQELATVRDDQLAIETAGVFGQLRVATYRSRTVRRQSLHDAYSSKQLETLEAVENGLESSLVSLDQRRKKLATPAPRSGIVLPTTQLSESANDQTWGNHLNLTDRIGMRSVTGTPWCRIASSHRLCVVLQVEAKYRESVSVGMLVRGHEMQCPTKIQHYRVVSISSVASNSDSPNSNSSLNRAMFEIIGEPILDQPTDADFLSRIGGTCRGVIPLPSRSLAADLVSFLQELLS